MRARTFAREIAFQVLYQGDLNPTDEKSSEKSSGSAKSTTSTAATNESPSNAMPETASEKPLRPMTDRFQDKAAQTRELMAFVRHLVELLDRDEPEAAEEEMLYTQWLRTPALVEFTRTLIDGVQTELKKIDEYISAAAAHWSLHRMAATDRNLLRLGAYELMFTETPTRVVIDEAVELAKRFGGAQSAQFVNGILDHLMHHGKPPVAAKS